MRYVCLIHFDPQKAFDGSVESNGILSRVGRYDDELKSRGHFVAAEALTLPNEAKTVSVRGGKVSATDGPFTEAKEVIGGFVMIEAHDLDEAVQLAAGSPFAELGHIEVRPVVDFSTPRPRL